MFVQLAWMIIVDTELNNSDNISKSVNISGQDQDTCNFDGVQDSKDAMLKK